MSVKICAAVKILAALSALLAAAAAGYAQSYEVNLTWTASASNSVATPTLVNVYRGVTTTTSCAGMTWTQVATGQPAAGPYADTTVSQGTRYCYEVRAYFVSQGATAEGASSNWAFVSVPVAKATAPSALIAVPAQLQP